MLQIWDVFVLTPGLVARKTPSGDDVYLQLVHHVDGIARNSGHVVCIFELRFCFRLMVY